MTADSAYDRFERALASLRGLSVGDALGSQFFVPANYPLLKNRALPPGDWQWTDDTEMASSVLSVLAAHERVDQDALAHSFARHHDFDRGYGPAVNRLLRLVREGGDWRELASALFQGQGSWGNGSAMRIAPLGAWYADDPEQATHQAEVSSYTTHQHREAVVGAMAVAAAAAYAGGPDRRCGRPDPAQRGRRRAATGARHARLPGRGDGRGGARQRASYECARHGAVRPLVRGTEPRRLRTGLLGDCSGWWRRGHHLRHRRRHRRRGTGRCASGRVAGPDGRTPRLAPVGSCAPLSSRSPADCRPPPRVERRSLPRVRC